MPRFDDILDKSLRLMTPPTSEPITVDQAKAHCAVPALVTDFDDQFRGWIQASREQVERDAEIALLPQTWELTLESLPSPTPYYSGNLSPATFNTHAIELRRPPVTEIVSFGYWNQLSVWTPMVENTDYLVNLSGEPALIVPPRNNATSAQWWPPMLPRLRGVVIVFKAGYTSPALVPEIAKQAMRLLIGHWWRNREATAERPTKDHDRAYASLVESLRWR